MLSKGWLGTCREMIRGRLTDSLYQDLPAKSNRLESQDAGVIGSQCFSVFAMLLSMISNASRRVSVWSRSDDSGSIALLS